MFKLYYLLFLLALLGCEKDPYFNSCKTNESIISPMVTAADSIRIFIPTAFTPNGDGLNDNFYPTGAGIKTFIVSVKYGNKNVFKGAENEKWNGMNKENSLYQGNFDYEIQLVSEMNKRFKITGTISLITDPLIDVCECHFEDMIDPRYGFVMPSQEGCN